MTLEKRMTVNRYSVGQLVESKEVSEDGKITHVLGNGISELNGLDPKIFPFQADLNHSVNSLSTRLCSLSEFQSREYYRKVERIQSKLDMIHGYVRDYVLVNSSKGADYDKSMNELVAKYKKVLNLNVDGSGNIMFASTSLNDFRNTVEKELRELSKTYAFKYELHDDKIFLSDSLSIAIGQYAMISEMVKPGLKLFPRISPNVGAFRIMYDSNKNSWKYVKPNEKRSHHYSLGEFRSEFIKNKKIISE